MNQLSGQATGAMGEVARTRQVSHAGDKRESSGILIACKIWSKIEILIQ